MLAQKLQICETRKFKMHLITKNKVQNMLFSNCKTAKAKISKFANLNQEALKFKMYLLNFK